MAVAGTNNTLTVDANVVNYYYRFKIKCSSPQDLPAKRIPDFCNFALDKFPIAINDFIRTEYQEVCKPQFIKNWLKERFKNDLAIEVECFPLPNAVTKSLQQDYGFDCQSRDARYLQTCLNTIFKCLVTENIKHFHRPHYSRGRRPMRAFLRRQLGIRISTIDQCCEEILDAKRN